MQPILHLVPVAHMNVASSYGSYIYVGIIRSSKIFLRILWCQHPAGYRWPQSGSA